MFTHFLLFRSEIYTHSYDNNLNRIDSEVQNNGNSSYEKQYWVIVNQRQDSGSEQNHDISRKKRNYLDNHLEIDVKLKNSQDYLFLSIESDILDNQKNETYPKEYSDITPDNASYQPIYDSSLKKIDHFSRKSSLSQELTKDLLPAAKESEGERSKQVKMSELNPIKEHDRGHMDDRIVTQPIHDHNSSFGMLYQPSENATEFLKHHNVQINRKRKQKVNNTEVSKKQMQMETIHLPNNFNKGADVEKWPEMMKKNHPVSDHDPICCAENKTMSNIDPKHVLFINTLKTNIIYCELNLFSPSKSSNNDAKSASFLNDFYIKPKSPSEFPSNEMQELASINRPFRAADGIMPSDSQKKIDEGSCQRQMSSVLEWHLLRKHMTELLSETPKHDIWTYCIGKTYGHHKIEVNYIKFRKRCGHIPADFFPITSQYFLILYVLSKNKFGESGVVKTIVQMDRYHNGICQYNQQCNFESDLIIFSEHYLIITFDLGVYRKKKNMYDFYTYYVSFTLPDCRNMRGLLKKEFIVRHFGQKIQVKLSRYNKGKIRCLFLPLNDEGHTNWEDQCSENYILQKSAEGYCKSTFEKRPRPDDEKSKVYTQNQEFSCHTIPPDISIANIYKNLSTLDTYSDCSMIPLENNNQFSIWHPFHEQKKRSLNFLQQVVHIYRLIPRNYILPEQPIQNI